VRVFSTEGVAVHTSGWQDACMSDRQEDTQQATDASFNTVALGRGRSVLRLDSRHSLRAWMAALGQAIVACMNGHPAQVFVSQS